MSIKLPTDLEPGFPGSLIKTRFLAPEIQQTIDEFDSVADINLTSTYADLTGNADGSTPRGVTMLDSGAKPTQASDFADSKTISNDPFKANVFYIGTAPGSFDKKRFVNVGGTRIEINLTNFRAETVGSFTFYTSNEVFTPNGTITLKLEERTDSFTGELKKEAIPELDQDNLNSKVSERITDGAIAVTRSNIITGTAALATQNDAINFSLGIDDDRQDEQTLFGRQRLYTDSTDGIDHLERVGGSGAQLDIQVKFIGQAGENGPLVWEPVDSLPNTGYVARGGTATISYTLDVPGIANLQTEVNTLTGDINTLDGEVDDLDTRVDTLEARPTGPGIPSQDISFLEQLEEEITIRQTAADNGIRIANGFGDWFDFSAVNNRTVTSILTVGQDSFNRAANLDTAADLDIVSAGFTDVAVNNANYMVAKATQTGITEAILGLKLERNGAQTGTGDLVTLKNEQEFLRVNSDGRIQIYRTSLTPGGNKFWTNLATADGDLPALETGKQYEIVMEILPTTPGSSTFEVIPAVTNITDRINYSCNDILIGEFPMSTTVIGFSRSTSQAGFLTKAVYIETGIYQTHNALSLLFGHFDDRFAFGYARLLPSSLLNTLTYDGTISADGIEVNGQELDPDAQLPAGGETGRVLAKTSGDDYAATWQSTDSLQGPQGAEIVRVFIRLAHNATAPGTPTGTDYNSATNTVTGLTTNWSTEFPSTFDPAVHDVYESFARYNPAAAAGSRLGAFAVPFKVDAEIGATGPAGPAGAKGEDGQTGEKGDPGVDGNDGAAGQGVPTGGSAGQILSKLTAVDYATGWINPPSGGGSSTVTYLHLGTPNIDGSTTGLKTTAAATLSLPNAGTLYDLAILFDDNTSLPGITIPTGVTYNSSTGTIQFQRGAWLICTSIRVENRVASAVSAGAARIWTDMKLVHGTNVRHAGSLYIRYGVGKTVVSGPDANELARGHFTVSGIVNSDGSNDASNLVTIKLCGIPQNAAGNLRILGAHLHAIFMGELPTT